MNETTAQWLTAAECALRTGVTVRALRVYENYGLIMPGRSAAGWRRYGAEELLKLNEIGLLMGALRHRRAEAERGLAVVQTALKHLQTGRSLSVEELCSLIRSFEMTTSTTDAAISAADVQVPSDLAALDRYAGYYLRNRALGVSTIIRKDAKLFLEPIGQPVLELEQTDEAEFALPKFDLVLCFDKVEEGLAHRLVIWQCGTALRLERIDGETSKNLKQAISDRIRDSVPMPGSEQVLRQILETGRAGNFNYDQMSTEFAQIVRTQGAYWQIVGQYFGAIVSIEFLRVSNQGWDIYRVQHENDVHQYRIALGDDGKVYGFSEASATADKRGLA
jgi:DNA-binding transcriptional MerR regulator